MEPLHPLKSLKEALGDGGGISTMRITVLGTAAIFVPTFTFVWARICLKTSTMVEIPDGVLWLLFILLLGKTAQKVVEVVASLKKA